MFYPTLNAALESQNLVQFWPLGSNINYGQTVAHTVQTGTRFTKAGNELPVFKHISVYRDSRGLYETPTAYFTH